MRLILLYTFLAQILLITALQSHSEPFKVPPMGSRESGTIVVSYKEGGTKWNADWTAEKYTENGQNYIRITFKGKGLLDPFSENVTWVSESIFSAHDSFIPISTVSTIRNMKGKVVRIEKKTFNSTKGSATYKREDSTQEGSFENTYEFTPETLTMEGITLALRTLSFESEEDVEASFLSNEPELYNVELKPRGIETVNTPEGDLECYKLELVPKLGVLGVFKVFFPKTYFWFSVEPPHRWVKYEGYENGRNSPEVVMKVEKFKSIQ